MDSGTFAFTAAESGAYMACYWAVDHKPPVALSIEFDWKSGVAAKDWSKVAKKGQVQVSISVKFHLYVVPFGCTSFCLTSVLSYLMYVIGDCFNSMQLLSFILILISQISWYTISGIGLKYFFLGHGT